MKIIISESQIDAIYEGVDFYNMKQNGTPITGPTVPIGMHINTQQSDKDNESTDTRFFGTPDDIIYGDGSSSSINLYQSMNTAKILRDFYKKLLDYYHNGQSGTFPAIPSNISFQTKASMRKAINNIQASSPNTRDMLIQNYISIWAKAYNKWCMYYDNYKSTFDNAQWYKNQGKSFAPRYSKGTIPQTSVEYYALFNIGSFNFSDAIKHGKARQSSDEFDALLGITKSERQKIPTLGKGKRPLSKIDVYYDADDITKSKPYDSKRNFSIQNANNDHPRTDTNTYDSVQQFLDKSIMAAKFVLTKENFNPDFIISPPSSSQFNEHYCIRLANKINAQYVPNFFEKNATEIVYDKEAALKSGLTQTDVMSFDIQINQAVRNEIGYICGKPISQFMDANSNQFQRIRLAKSSREFAPFHLVKQIYVNYINDLVYQYFDESNDLDTITNYIISAAKRVAVDESHKVSGYDYDFLLSQIKKVTNKHGGMLRDANNTFHQVISEVVRYVNYYRKKLTDGYKINFNSSTFKIVKFDMRFRPFIKNLYVVARKNFNSNNELLSKYKTSRFLIFDEDLNSGGTLKNIIDALISTLPANYNASANIKCLVNGVQFNSK